MPKEKNPICVAVGRNVSRLRREAGLSQEMLAQDADLDRSYVGGVERGERNVSVVNLCRLAEPLGVEPRSFLEGVSIQLLGQVPGGNPGN